MATYGFRVRSLQKAVHLTVSVVKEFQLPNSKLIRLVFLGVLRDLLDGFFRQLQVVMVIHELWHFFSPRNRAIPSSVLACFQSPKITRLLIFLQWVRSSLSGHVCRCLQDMRRQLQVGEISYRLSDTGQVTTGSSLQCTVAFFSRRTFDANRAR